MLFEKLRGVVNDEGEVCAMDDEIALPSELGEGNDT